MANKSHRKNRRRARRASSELRWLAPLAARTAATLLLMVAARLLHVAVVGG